VYLFRTAVEQQAVLPNAKIPLVLLPVAEPDLLATLALPTPVAVDEQQAYVYLFRVAVKAVV
jgi:hypothetical protein